MECLEGNEDGEYVVGNMKNEMKLQNVLEKSQLRLERRCVRYYRKVNVEVEGNEYRETKE